MVRGRRVRCGVLTGLCVSWWLLGCAASSLRAEVFFGPIENPGTSGGGFSNSQPFLSKTGLYNFDGHTESNGNQVLRIPSGFHQFGLHSANLSVKLSNGENGNDGDDPFNPDVINQEQPHPDFQLINDPANRLENGNTIRFSLWMKVDPEDPVLVPPTIEPLLNIELWTEALSFEADTERHSHPQYGDRIYDTHLNGNTATYVDMNGDGFANGQPGGGLAEVTLSRSRWTLVSTTLTVSDVGWGYDLASGFVPKSVADVEEVRATFTLAEYLNTDLTNGGSILIDQPMVEIYRAFTDMPLDVPNPSPLIGFVDADFNNDTLVNCEDVDALVAEIASGGQTIVFDLNGDGQVDRDDLDTWLVVAGNLNLSSGGAYLPGDANLDGFVDVSDFNIWNGNKLQALPAWCGGDFSADGFVDVSDFNIWNAHKFEVSGGSQVPEPAGAPLAWGALLAAFWVARRQPAGRRRRLVVG